MIILGKIMNKNYIIFAFLCVLSSALQAGGAVAATTLPAITEAPRAERVLSDEDLKAMSNKKLHDKAWKNFDSFLTKIMLTSAAVGGIGYALPAGKYGVCGLATFNYNPTASQCVKRTPDAITISRPRLIKGSFAVAAVAALLKVGVKIKRAHDHGDNPVHFIFTDMWAK
jgi:hypothetical protein